MPLDSRLAQTVESQILSADCSPVRSKTYGDGEAEPELLREAVLDS